MWRALASTLARRRPPLTRALATAAPASAPPRRRRAAWLLLVPPAAAAGLSVWQLERRRWKLGLVQAWEAALQADPVALDALPRAPPPLTRATAAGTLRPASSARVGPRPRADVGGTLSGAILVTPLTSPTGRPALLVRGWVPAGWTEDHDEICITAVPAVVRASESPSSFVPANDAARGTWHWLDGPALAAAAGLPPDTLLLEVVRPEGGRSRPPGAMDVLGGRTGNKPPPPVYPLPRALADVASVSVTPATHAQYAATWGSLAVATAGLAVKALRK